MHIYMICDNAAIGEQINKICKYIIIIIIVIEDMETIKCSSSKCQ